MGPSVLDRILSKLSVDVEAFAICDVGADGAILIPRLGKIEVHYVLEGELHLVVEGLAPLVLGPGAVVLVPPGRTQRLAATTRPSKLHVSREIRSQRADGFVCFDGSGGKQVAVRVMCGEIRADVSGLYGPFEGVTGPIASGLGEVPLVRSAFSTLLAEAAGPGAASRALCGALMKACLVLLLRRHVQEHGTSMLPGVFSKPWLGRAVSAVLETPEQHHTVASLAALAGRSRSSFAREFSNELGIPPIEFVAQVRLACARDLLSQTPLAISEIASRVGFVSRSHFTRSFRSAFGADPRSWRQERSSMAASSQPL